MGAPKGHPNWNTCKDMFKNGGYFGRHEDTYTDEELHELGKGLIEYMMQDNAMWMKGFFTRKAILWPTVAKLEARAPFFKQYIDAARAMQEEKLTSDPYDKRTNKDAAHARFILARHHRGEWQDQQIVAANEAEKAKLDNTLGIVDYLQKQKEKDMESE